MRRTQSAHTLQAQLAHRLLRRVEKTRSVRERHEPSGLTKRRPLGFPAFGRWRTSDEADEKIRNLHVAARRRKDRDADRSDDFAGNAGFFLQFADRGFRRGFSRLDMAFWKNPL